VNSSSNQLVLTAAIAELAAPRFTPAGLPALDLRLEHESRALEAGQERQVTASVKAVAFGALAERLARQDIGSHWRFSGFVATPRNGKNLVFHIQEFSQD
jgi:primosomal replication protein N